MTKVKLIGSLQHDGVAYKAGDVFEGDKAVVDNLIALGTAQDPNAADTAIDTSVDDAKAEAAKIISTAEAEAHKIAEAAKADAEKVVAAAKTEAQKIRDEAASKAALKQSTPAK